MTPSYSLLLVCVLLGTRSVASYGSCNGKKMIKSGGLTCQEQQTIVYEHNKLRQSIALGQVSGQPSAANMREMVWDEGLATVAQSWADQCTVAHDHARGDGRFPVGQNLAATWTTRSSVSPSPDFQRQITGWYNEVHSFSYYSTGFTAGTGHYSQLVWGDSHLVGCGYAFYYDRSKGYTKLYVCNYGPGGNVIGEKPYTSGPQSCSSYGLGTSSKFNGLCEVLGYSAVSTCSYSSSSRPYSYTASTDYFSSATSRLPYNSAYSFYYGKK